VFGQFRRTFQVLDLLVNCVLAGSLDVVFNPNIFRPWRSSFLALFCKFKNLLGPAQKLSLVLCTHYTLPKVGDHIPYPYSLTLIFRNIKTLHHWFETSKPSKLFRVWCLFVMFAFGLFHIYFVYLQLLAVIMIWPTSLQWYIPITIVTRGWYYECMVVAAMA
jgi:hypothetical protein